MSLYDIKLELLASGGYALSLCVDGPVTCTELFPCHVTVTKFTKVMQLNSDLVCLMYRQLPPYLVQQLEMISSLANARITNLRPTLGLTGGGGSPYFIHTVYGFDRM